MSVPAVLVDANLILWAHHRTFGQHDAASAWWAETLSGTPVVGVPWVVVLAFLRFSTHPRALARPLDIGTAWGVVAGWLERPNVSIPTPGPRHATILSRLLLESNARGNHTTDAHLAALALEHGLHLQSADADFARYAGLRWGNPLLPRMGTGS